MRIIVGHSNMDLDCLGSLALARVLFPGYKAVRSRLIHPVARTLYNLYADYLDMASVADIDGEPVESMVVVDTRSRGRIKEYLDAIGPLPTDRSLGPSPRRLLGHRGGDPSGRPMSGRTPLSWPWRR